MVVIARPFRFADDDPRPMLRHLDDWARRDLTSPEAWGSTLERCGQWVDYSGRNQVLLASYGIATPVAGSATWERVPSSEEGRSCAVRAGEHGLPVRAPVVESGDSVSDRVRTSARSTSNVAALRWEAVFAAEQLARHPAPDALTPPTVPALSEREWVEAVRVTSGRMLGRTPRRVDDLTEQLTVLAGRVGLGSGRLRLDGDLAGQAGRLVACRVGIEAVPMPTFSPGVLSTRERWRTLADVRHATGEVLRAMSFALGVDLRASALPRHELVDDRTVTPGRRNCLAPADLRGLPVGVWIEAGPYTKGEWLARGVAGGSGVGAFCRMNDRSYLAAYETRNGAMWRLETVGRGAHHGVVAEGVADTLTDAKDAAHATLLSQFPDASSGVLPEPSTAVIGPQHGWVRLVGGRDDRTERRVIDERVAAMVSPGPGGRWQTWTTVDGTPRQGPLTSTAEEARITADGLAAGALVELAALAPDRAERLVYDAATSNGWDRATLVAATGTRLTDEDRATLATTTEPGLLVEMMRNTGVLAPSTMLAVLHAEGVDADTVIGLVPALGLPVPDALRFLHRDWHLPRLDAGAALGATLEELRAAGCSTVEMLAAAPREELRRLDTREHTWELAGPSLLEAGYTTAEAVQHLAAHAPTPATFAVGVTTIVDRPVDAFVFAARRAQTDDLVALSERYELDPPTTARVLAAADVSADRAVEVIAARCDGDRTMVRQFAWDALALQPSTVDGLLDTPASSVTAIGRTAGDDITIVESDMEPVSAGVELL